MADIPGVRPSQPLELSRAEDRLSFLYLEHCTIGRDSNALTATDDRGTIYIPTAALGVLMLGPGTRVTHQAMMVIADSASSVVWVGENGVRYYAHGRPLARSSRLLLRQAELISNQRSRLAVARQMYEMRFPTEDTTGSSMQQLRGREGARIRKVYRRCAEDFEVEWTKRDYSPEEFESSDAINQALTAAHQCLYGVVHSVIVALGLSPGLGFIHTGNDRSFVYDVADLYKAEIAIPRAFAVTAECLSSGDGELAISNSEFTSRVRRAMRDEIRTSKLLTRCVEDIKLLISDPAADDAAGWELADVLELWDETRGTVASGQNYAEDSPW